MNEIEKSQIITVKQNKNETKQNNQNIETKHKRKVCKIPQNKETNELNNTTT